MNIVTTAIKNLFRYKRRTFITVIAIAIALIFYIYADSIMGGWYHLTEKEYLEYEVADGRIVRSDWWEEKERFPLSLSIENPEEITSVLDRLGIEYTTRIQFIADLVFYEDPFPSDGFLPTVITAVDPVRDRDIFKLSESINYKESRGEFLKEGEEGVVIGNALAEELGADIGYPIRIQCSGKGGVSTIIDTTIIGIVKTGSTLTNFNGIFIPMDVADYYLEMEDAVTFISIKTAPGPQGRKQLKELKKLLPPQYSLLGYEEVAFDFMALKQSKDSFIYIFLLVIAIIAVVGVNNTMMMAVFERRREIGMMRALGFSEKKIARMFFYEAMGIGVIGSIFGLSLGALLNIPLVNWGINYGAMMAATGDAIDFGGVAIRSVLKGMWQFKTFLIGGIFSIVISLIAAILPVVKMLKKPIPDNLRTN